jgi:hypothetical protein
MAEQPIIKPQIQSVPSQEQIPQITVSRVETQSITSIAPEKPSTKSVSAPIEVDNTLAADDKAINTQTILEETMHMEDYITPTVSGEAKVEAGTEARFLDANSKK